MRTAEKITKKLGNRLVQYGFGNDGRRKEI
jgi:hypothetical protein